MLESILLKKGLARTLGIAAVSFKNDIIRGSWFLGTSYPMEHHMKYSEGQNKVV